MSTEGLLRHCLEEHRPDLWSKNDTQWTGPAAFKEWLLSHYPYNVDSWHALIHRYWPTNSGSSTAAYVRNNHKHEGMKL
jgi:hypothetical protein